MFTTCIMKEKKTKKIIFQNILKFLCICLFCLLFTLTPMLIKMVKQDFSYYSSWNLGGISYEFLNQFKHLGLLFVIVMIIGVIFALVNKSYRKHIIVFGLTWIIALFMFAKTQNMGTHQTLILMPTYILCFFFCIVGISSIKNSYVRKIGYLLIIFILMLNWFGSITENKYLHNNLYYTDISIKPTKRKEYENIGKMVQFIQENINEDDIVYINAASGDYCAQTFSGYVLPDLSLTDRIVYESSIDAAHGFPISSIAEAKYIFTTNIDIEATGAKKGHIISTINEAINKDTIVRTKFKFIKEFVMSDTVTFYAYERVKKIDQEEVDYWKKALEEPSKDYPQLFNNRIDAYLEHLKDV